MRRHLLLRALHQRRVLSQSRGIHTRAFEQARRTINPCTPSKHIKYTATRWASAASSPNSNSPSPTVLINDIANQELLIEISPGQAARYPSFWLRDHCLCSVCSHPHTRQRQHDTFALDPAVKATNTSSTESGLEVTWSDSNHVSHFPWSWLQQHTPFPTPTNNATTRYQKTRQWTPFLPSTPLPKTSYESITSSNGLSSLLSQLQEYGIAFITSTPASPQATENLLNHIGPIRHTHYGGFWDFTSEPNPIDTAYTTLYLPLHTDNTYFTEPAGLQLFHLLSHTTASAPTNNPGDYSANLGGESTFTDGFAAASKLFDLNPAYYQVLSTVPIIFAAEGSPVGNFRNNHIHTTGSPVLTHNIPGTASSALRPENLTMVRWNNLDRSPLTLFPSHSIMLQWFAAAKLFSEILHSEEFMLTTPLKPGMPVIFDNWRVLHGRLAFEGNSRRRVCGAYVQADDWKGRIAKMTETTWSE